MAKDGNHTYCSGGLLFVSAVNSVQQRALVEARGGQGDGGGTRRVRNELTRNINRAIIL